MASRMLFHFSDGSSDWRFHEDDPPTPGDKVVSDKKEWIVLTVEPHDEGTWIVTLGPVTDDDAER